MKRPFLFASIAAALLAGCPSAECPAGFVRSGDLCLAAADAATPDVDASVDGGTGDAHLPCGGSCPGSAPHCVVTGPTETCVECRSSTDCSGSRRVCDLAHHTCVACMDATTCNDRAHAVCDAASETCVACSTNADCAHLGYPICSGGVCVRCTIRDESACSGHSCDPATGECTGTPVRSLGECDACVADSECNPPALCIPMNFQGAPRSGGYCLTPSAAGCGACGTITDARVSLSGQPAATYCGVPEDFATCESLRDQHDMLSCTMDSDCGAPGLDDGRCTSGHVCFSGCSMTCQCPGGFGYTCRADHFCG